MEKFKNSVAKDEKELAEMESSLQKESLNLRFQQASGQLKKYRHTTYFRRQSGFYLKMK